MEYRVYSILATIAAYGAYCINWYVNGSYMYSAKTVIFGIILVIVAYFLCGIYEINMLKAKTETQIMIAATQLALAAISTFAACIFIGHTFIAYMCSYSLGSYVTYKRK